VLLFLQNSAESLNNVREQLSLSLFPPSFLLFLFFFISRLFSREKCGDDAHYANALKGVLI
jgi:hypothetical protein